MPFWLCLQPDVEFLYERTKSGHEFDPTTSYCSYLVVFFCGVCFLLWAPPVLLVFCARVGLLWVSPASMLSVFRALFLRRWSFSLSMIS